ncbi:hypothetical protein PV416_42490 [Streptomyces ipomoeae]|nr:hypothetical protein [Streptomyces ipomoeae]MDX2827555.1 hypothetical protein [Streptomyces ipomoeae]MDX2880760.1 hypothetical protein [Streptomyces ipomoeae]
MRGSPRKRAPAATATAGLTYVKTVARVGPTSRISSRKATKASAVQITPRPAREARTGPEGIVLGQVRAAAGAYTIAVRSRTGAISCSVETCFRWRAMIRGAVA